VAGAGAGEVAVNGDYNTLNPSLAGGIAVGNAPGTVQDVFRLYHQASEQIHWTFGAGLKPSLQNVPSYYLPAGGGLYGDIGSATDLLLLNNGMPSQESITRLGRAVMIPPRQNIICQAQCFPLPNTNAGLFGTAQGARNMLSITDNLNAIDGVAKMCSFYLDGLFSRDVQ